MTDGDTKKTEGEAAALVQRAGTAYRGWFMEAGIRRYTSVTSLLDEASPEVFGTVAPARERLSAV